jgi:hypothetical protein
VGWVGCGASQLILVLGGPKAMNGYRLRIAPDDYRGQSAEHYCGCGSVGDAARVACPNCRRWLFPVFNLSFGDDRLAGLGVWSRPRATVVVCPACALYMEPYFIHHVPELSVSGGERDGGQVLQDVDHPYACRLITLHALPDADADAPGHQVGGAPPGAASGRAACPSCSKPMSFFGIVGYDDLNVPLSENGGTPVALIIGDGDHLTLLSCSECAIIRVEWSVARGRLTSG